MSLKPPYNRPYIDLLLEEYFPKENYPHRIRKKAKQMALDFHKDISAEKAMQDDINTKLLFGDKTNKP